MSDTSSRLLEPRTERAHPGQRSATNRPAPADTGGSDPSPRSVKGLMRLVVALMVAALACATYGLFVLADGNGTSGAAPGAGKPISVQQPIDDASQEAAQLARFSGGSGRQANPADPSDPVTSADLDEAMQGLRDSFVTRSDLDEAVQTLDGTFRSYGVATAGSLFLVLMAVTGLAVVVWRQA